MLIIHSSLLILNSTEAVRAVPKFKDSTDKSIEEAIRNWLRHAFERRVDSSSDEEVPEVFN